MVQRFISSDSKMKFRVIWSEEDQEYVGLCDEYPSLSYLAESEREALQGIKDLVEYVIVDSA